MRHTISSICLLLVFLLLSGCATGKAELPAAESVDSVIAVVNGEPVLQSDFEPYRQSYLGSYAVMGLDPENTAAVSYIEDTALTACIQDILIRQDMETQGCYETDDATELWLREAGVAAYESALLTVEDYLRGILDTGADSDMSAAAQSYAAEQNITEDNYIQVYREQYARACYETWLIRDNPVTEEDVLEAYQARTEADRIRFGTDILSFEAAIASGEQVWYQPKGYRSILHILLQADGDTEEDKLFSVADEVDTIYRRLENGEPFVQLIAEYGCDTVLKDTEALKTGYSVHRDSVLWEEAFIDAAFELAAPGCWSSEPVVSRNGVHILYYLKDAEGGPVPLTDAIGQALLAELSSERAQQALATRLEELSAAAEVTYP